MASGQREVAGRSGAGTGAGSRRTAVAWPCGGASGPASSKRATRSRRGADAAAQGDASPRARSQPAGPVAGPPSRKAAPQPRGGKAARARARAARGRIEAATAAWERAGDVRALAELASALLAGGDTGAALALLGSWGQAVAGDPALMRLRAVALRRAERWAEAADAFDGLAAALPAGVGASRPRAGPDWAWAEAMDCRLRDRGPAEAAEAMRRMLLLPSVAANPYAVALHGRLLMKAGEVAAAVAPLLSATAALPGDERVAAAAAFAVRRARGPLAAMPLLIRSLRIRPDQRAVLGAVVADAVRLRRVAATRRVLIELARSAPRPGPVWNAVRRLGSADAAARQGG